MSVSTSLFTYLCQLIVDQLFFSLERLLLNIRSFYGSISCVFDSVSIQGHHCTVLVVFRHNEETGGKCLKDGQGNLYRFSVTIVDLDPKPFSKIPTYHKQDKQIVTAYREAAEGSSPF